MNVIFPIAAVVCSLLLACGGSVPPESPPSSPATPPPPAGSGSSGSSKGTALCEPANACGGLTECVDACYGERCCHLSCICGPDDRLRCGLGCQK